MHNEFKALLPKAEGHSRHVVVVFLDVRGFSSFARIEESTDTAEFLKSVYLTVLEDYFPKADFFKPTGDGLLILYGYDRDSLTAAVRSAVDRSIALVESFPSICDEDQMVNFEVPTKLGIGLARGSATALMAGEKILDYSGRPLNLASRLMDLARPSGVVFDSSLGVELLEPEVQERFEEEIAYIKGIAEARPITVYRLEGYTEIPDFNKRPMDRFDSHTEEPLNITLKEFEESYAPKFRHMMTREPARTDNLEMHVSYPAIKSNGSRNPGLIKTFSLPAEYLRATGNSYAVVDYTTSVSRLKEAGVKGPWSITLTLEYSVMPGEDN